jgi:hypothetical protein
LRNLKYFVGGEVGQVMQAEREVEVDGRSTENSTDLRKIY